MIEQYLRAQGLFRSVHEDLPDPVYTGEIMELDLSTIVPSIAGPKRPHDLIRVAQLKEDFNSCLRAPVGFKGFDIAANELGSKSTFSYEGSDYELRHGSIVISAITSCTNTSNPSVML